MVNNTQKKKKGRGRGIDLLKTESTEGKKKKHFWSGDILRR
jgi:hypothetical protein